MFDRLLGAIQQLPFDAFLLVAVVLVAVPVFLMSPASLVLNFITVPLGYEWQSCPYCPEFGIEKITKAECEQCGEVHAENWGAAKYKDGDRLPFCSNECLDDWNGGSA